MLLTHTVTIHCSHRRGFDYLSDFSNLFEWDDQVTEGWRHDLGPIREGSTFSLRYVLLGQKQLLTYTLKKMEQGRKLVFECKTEKFTGVDTIVLKEVKGGTEVTYQADLTIKPRFNEVVLRPFFERLIVKVLTNLKSALEGGQANQIPSAEHGKRLNLVNVPYWFTASGWNKARKSFTATENGAKKVLITGPTSGIGRSAALTLAGKGADLVLIARDAGKLQQLSNELRTKGFKGTVDGYLCDMHDLRQVFAVSSQILQDGHQLDALINNAGALYGEEKLIDNVERTTTVDLLAPWIFSTRLLPALLPRKGCIVNVTSGGMYGVKLSLRELRRARTPYSGARAYAQAKRAMVMFTVGLNKEFSPHGVRVHCMHPGWADTPGVLHSLPTFHKLTKRFLRSSFQGADTMVWLAMTNPKVGGKMWLDRQVQPEHLIKSTADNPVEYDELKSFLEELVGSVDKQANSSHIMTQQKVMTPMAEIGLAQTMNAKLYKEEF